MTSTIGNTKRSRHLIEWRHFCEKIPVQFARHASGRLRKNTRVPVPGAGKSGALFRKVFNRCGGGDYRFPGPPSGRSVACGPFHGTDGGELRFPDWKNVGRGPEFKLTPGKGGVPDFPSRKENAGLTVWTVKMFLPRVFAGSSGRRSADAP